AADPRWAGGESASRSRRRSRCTALERAAAPRLPDAARRRIAFDDVHVSLPGRHVHARHPEVVEVVLLRPTLAERDLTVEGRAQAHDGCAFHLRADPV